ncbi:Hypothetical_protein [Hexamita inflata]|uniref:Hypothetical_protein n=1 Tax=Hexamita inflata TaxID=28002 RepID=A0AA86P7X9_9EUKA|nr:Hypothetical protein HINF_LOCUS21402 [Hexamita inflata]
MIVKEVYDHNKAEILQQLDIRQIDKQKMTQPRTKLQKSGIYIKILNISGNEDTQVKILNTTSGQNLVLYGDYYILKKEIEYVMLNVADEGESYSLHFDHEVSFEWYPEFIDIVRSSSGIQIVMLGEYYSYNQYYYNNYISTQPYKVIAGSDLVLVKDPSSKECIKHSKQQVIVKQHQQLDIRQLCYDYGLITFEFGGKQYEGWICIRFVTQLGREYLCSCRECINNKLKKLPIELTPNDNSTTYKLIIQEVFMRKMLEQFHSCKCQECQERYGQIGNNILLKYWQQSRCSIEQLPLDIVKKGLFHFYQPHKRCIKCKYIRIQEYLGKNMHYITTTEKLQKQFTDTILPKCYEPAPESLKEDLKTLVQKCDKTQLDDLLEQINILTSCEPKYSIVALKDNIRNWNRNINMKIDNTYFKDQITKIIETEIWRIGIENQGQQLQDQSIQYEQFE